MTPSQLVNDHQGLNFSEEELLEGVRESVRRACRYMEEKKYAEAETVFSAIIIFFPKTIETYLALAYAQAMQAKFDQAEQVYRKILEMDPNCADAQRNLSVVCEAQGKDQTSHPA